MGLVEKRGGMKGEELAWRIEREREREREGGDKYDVLCEMMSSVCGKRFWSSSDLRSS